MSDLCPELPDDAGKCYGGLLIQEVGRRNHASANCSLIASGLTSRQRVDIPPLYDATVVAITRDTLTITGIEWFRDKGRGKDVCFAQSWLVTLVMPEDDNLGYLVGATSITPCNKY